MIEGDRVIFSKDDDCMECNHKAGCISCLVVAVVCLDLYDPDTLYKSPYFRFGYCHDPNMDRDNVKLIDYRRFL